MPEQFRVFLNYSNLRRWFVWFFVWWICFCGESWMEKNVILGVCVCVSVFVFVLGDRKNHNFVVQPKLEGRVVLFFQQHLVVVSLYVNCTLGRDVFLFGERFGNEPGWSDVLHASAWVIIRIQIHKNFANTRGLQKDVKQTRDPIIFIFRYTANDILPMDSIVWTLSFKGH